MEGLRAIQFAQWQKAQVVLLCRPGIETLCGILETNSANFCRPFSLEKASAEHDHFRRVIESRGARVIDVREALLYGTVDGMSSVSSANLERLRHEALKSVRYVFENRFTGKENQELDRNLHETIEALHPKDLAEIVFLRPDVLLRINRERLDATTRFCSEFLLRPATNQYFVRDPMITTAVGAVIGRTRLDMRRIENEIVELALRQLGVEPIYRVQPPGFLEGGDFIPCGDFVFQGEGLLSNREGIQQLLDNGAYGPVEVAVVKDKRSQMDQMHLDTFFNVVSRDLAVCCQNRTGPEEPEVDVYHPEETAGKVVYRKSKTVRFLQYLRDKRMDIIPFAKEESYASNFFPLMEGVIVGVKQAGGSFEKRLRVRGVEAEFIDLESLTGGYGGAHCMSQAILRS
jgi:arginine deiminase